MTFKNQKEEVIEIHLTSYGKHLLSIGELDPEYYAFYDDDILYDPRYGHSNVESSQNYEQERILTETPRTRNQIYFFGAETEVERQIELYRSQAEKPRDSFSTTIDSDYVLSLPLSRSSLFDDQAPSWDFTIYGAEFESYTAKKQSTQHTTLNIPQVELTDTVLKSRVTTTPIYYRPYSTQDLMQTEYANGKNIVYSASEFILEIDEEHSIPLSKNYDVEVYVIEESVDDSGNIIEEERKLSFSKQRLGYKIEDDVLYEVEDDLPLFELDPSYVEYYLDLSFDTEIEKELLCELGYRTDYRKRGYIPVNCGDETTLGADVYDSDTPIEPFGDDC